VSLRVKLLIGVIVLVFAGLAVSDVVTYTSLRSFLLRRVDQQLVSGADAAADAALSASQGRIGPFPGQDHGATALPSGTFGEVLDSQGNVLGKTIITYTSETTPPDPALPSTLPRTGTSEPDIFTTGAVDGSSLRYRVLVGQGVLRPSGEQATVIIGIPLTEVGATLHRLGLIAGLVTGLVVLGLGFLSWWLVRRELRPLEEIGVTAGAIAAGDLTQRVAREDSKTEIGRLGTALNAMLAQIEQAFAERKASEDRLRRFLADASHELRTPLTSIRGYAELFRRGAAEREEDLEKSMRRIEDEAARMGVMVEDLLLLARMDQGRPLEMEAVDLAALAADAVADARAMDGGREIALETLPAVVVGDEARLRQVAANLVANAVVHTPPGTPVTVRTMVEGDDAVFEVADRGPGLSPEDAGRAFEPFFRLDPSRDRTTGGAGLGLSIVDAIAKAHGGRVDLETSPGAGATFRVIIPTKPETNARPTESA
jgi:two-component system OmpR family sensor kinase